MRGPKPPTVGLSPEHRAELEAFVRRHGAPQQRAMRGRAILPAGDGSNNSEIARLLGVGVDTVRAWRTRWLEYAGVSLEDLGVEERPADAPTPGAPARIGPEQVCRVIELACEAPEKSGRPISR